MVPTTPRRPPRAYALLALAQVAVGAAAIFARFALGGAGAIAVSAGRLTLAALVFALYAALRRVPTPVADAGERRAFVIAALALAAHFATWIWSLEYLAVGVSTLLVATTPLWTALYDACAHHRRTGAMTLVSFLAGGIGTALLVRNAHARPPLPGHTALGVALALTGAVAIAAYFLAVRGLHGRFSTTAIVVRTYSGAAALLLATTVLARQPFPSANDLQAWGGIVGMALVSQSIGHTALNASLRWFSASAVAFSTLLEPVCAGAFGWLLFAEAIPPLGLVGAFFVLAAIAGVLHDEAKDWTAPVTELERSMGGGMP